MTKIFSWIETVYSKSGWGAALAIGVASGAALLGTAWYFGIGADTLAGWLEGF